VAVGLKRAHAKFVGQGEGLPVSSVGLCDFRGMALGSNLPEESQRMGLVSAFLMLTGVCEGTLGECQRVLLAVCQEMDPRAHLNRKLRFRITPYPTAFYAVMNVSASITGKTTPKS